MCVPSPDRDGLSLAESVAIVEERVAVERAGGLFVGRATTFFSYSWTGTRLVDMLYAIIRRVEALEKEDGRRRYVWIDMFCASQNLLAGAFLPIDPTEREALKASNPDEYGRRKEQTDKLFDGAIDSVNEIFFYRSAARRRVARATASLPAARPRRATGRLDRRGPGAGTRAWCVMSW